MNESNSAEVMTDRKDLMRTNPAGNILAELIAADDPTGEWPKAELLVALGFRPGVNRNLCEWHWGDRESVSLAEIFELLISSNRDPRPGYLICPILDCRNVGRKGFLQLVQNMSRIDFGPKCRAAWQERHQLFLAAHRLKGPGDYSWSFPITAEGHLMARFKGGARYWPRYRDRD